jgi:hypothetical protein
MAPFGPVQVTLLVTAAVQLQLMVERSEILDNCNRIVDVHMGSEEHQRRNPVCAATLKAKA